MKLKFTLIYFLSIFLFHQFLFSEPLDKSFIRGLKFDKAFIEAVDNWDLSTVQALLSKGANDSTKNDAVVQQK